MEDGSKMCFLEPFASKSEGIACRMEYLPYDMLKIDRNEGFYELLCFLCFPWIEESLI